MSTTPEQIEANVIRHAQQAWHQVKADPSLFCWLEVGRGLEVGRAIAMRQAHTDRPRGKAYNLAFSHWLKEHQLDGVNEADRHALLQILDNRAAIGAWHASLPYAEQFGLNHPAVLWRKYKAAGPPEVAIMLDADAAANGRRIANRMRQLGLTARQQCDLVRRSCRAAVAELRNAAAAPRD